jgi:hypothetical protein
MHATLRKIVILNYYIFISCHYFINIYNKVLQNNNCSIFELNNLTHLREIISYVDEIVKGVNTVCIILIYINMYLKNK